MELGLCTIILFSFCKFAFRHRTRASSLGIKGRCINTPDFGLTGFRLVSSYSWPFSTHIYSVFLCILSVIIIFLLLLALELFLCHCLMAPHCLLCPVLAWCLAPTLALFAFIFLTLVIPLSLSLPAL